MNDKFELRREMRSVRRTFVEARSSNLFSSQILLDYLDKYFIHNTKLFSAYISSPFECDVMPSLLEDRGERVSVALPCADSREEELVFRYWRQGEPLVKSSLGFTQPLPNAALAQPDVILTPILAFDRQMGRLGQGAGHFDRAFARFPGAIKIGIAWSVQEVNALPLDPWDVPLDAIFTERELIPGPYWA